METITTDNKKIEVSEVRYYDPHGNFKGCTKELYYDKHRELKGWHEVQTIENVRYKGEYFQHAKYCPKCNIPYLPRKKIRQEDKQTVSFIQPGVALYVGKGVIHCKREHHKIEPVTGLLRSLRSGIIQININYCQNEDMYFISYSDYAMYRDEYGILLGNFNLQACSSSRDYDGPIYDGGESLLHEYGYNVDKNNGMTAVERQHILGNLMDFGIIDKERIKSYLRYFIHQHQHMSGHEEACQKWQEDLMWVQDYGLGDHRKKNIGSTKQYRR